MVTEARSVNDILMLIDRINSFGLTFAKHCYRGSHHELCNGEDVEIGDLLLKNLEGDVDFNKFRIQLLMLPIFLKDWNPKSQR